MVEGWMMGEGGRTILSLAIVNWDRMGWMALQYTTVHIEPAWW